MIAHNPIIPLPNFKPGGGEISMLELAEYLAKKGHEITVLQFFSFSKRKTDKGVIFQTIKATNNKEKLSVAKRFASNLQPDLILTWSFESKIAHNIKKTLGIPYVFFVHRFETLIGGYFKLFRNFEKLLPSLKNSQFRGGKNTLKIPLRLGYAFLMDKLVYGTSIAKSFHNADLVVANSEYTKRMIKKIIGCDSIVSYYRLHAEKYLVKKRGEFITSIGLGKKSGHKMMEELAKSMPEHQFFSVGHKNKIFLPNLKIRRTYIDDTREIYKQTKIFISAREHPEAFGRVPVEAMLSGIPSIATDLGGHAESVNGGGILIKASAPIIAWKKAILDIEKNYSKFSKKAAKHAKSFDTDKPKAVLEKYFKKIIKKLI